jgi:hypothetical protein
MPEKITKKPDNPVSGFVKRCIAFCGKLFQPEKSMIRPGSAWQDVPLDITDEVNMYLEMRHVQPDELKQVIFHAETTGDKLYQPEANRFLGKLKIGNTMFYADYGYGEAEFIVKMGYTHRSEIVG